ncbi:MAG TPA: hypothetical protein VMW32_07285 [Bacteroidales bacterium]|nr:hypothetical protein [Bacteroidales bacterium]
MIEYVTLPPELIEFIGSESKDFSVKAHRSLPVKLSPFLLLFGAIWLAFTSIIVIDVLIVIVALLAWQKK